MDRNAPGASLSTGVTNASPLDTRRSPANAGEISSAHLGTGPSSVGMSTSLPDASPNNNAVPGPSRKRDASVQSTSDPGKDANPRPSKQASVGVAQKADEDKGGVRRAAQACMRCRKQKLRCIGGNPCDRCVKSMNTCNFGDESMTAPMASSNPSAEEATARLQQLESSIADLLAGLARGSQSTLPNDNPLLRQFANPSQTILPSPPPPFSHQPALNPPILPTPSSSLSGPPVNTSTHFPGSVSSSQPEEMLNPQVRFNTSPYQISPIHHEGTPSNFSGSVFGGPSSVDERGQSTGEQPKRKSRGQGPAERLAAVTEQPFDAPFKALTYEPKVWDNREASRMNSPDRDSVHLIRDDPIGPPHWHDYRGNRLRATPLTTGIVDVQTAEALFQFFIDHCHPFIPIVNIALEDVFGVIRSSPALFSGILGIAARFYPRATNRFSRMRRGQYPPLADSVPQRLANLAEMQMGYTMLSKTLALSDVQAILLLAAWGLQPEGSGPDAWIVTGHASRIARRLGVHKVLAQAAETARRTQPGSEEWIKLEAYLPQWRTWLCWYGTDNFLSLGFGRPQSELFESVEEAAFLKLRKSQPLPPPDTPARAALHGDVYIASLVSLAQIGRDLTKWGQVLASPERTKEDPRMKEWAENKDLKLSTMFKELNGRLDDWCKLWVWTGSPYALYLGSSVRIARVQAEHLRLCLNSYALKAGADEDGLTGRCLKKALNAAMGTIQTHFESSQTDLALSFATDYLVIALAQAAFFLVRISCAPESVRKVVDFDLSIVMHYLKMSVDLLESADVTEIRLPTFLAKTIREIALAGGITGLGASTYSEGPLDTRVSFPRDIALQTAGNTMLNQGHQGQAGLFGSNPMIGPSSTLSDFARQAGSMFDNQVFADPFSDKQMFDFSSLLGLSGDQSGKGDAGNLFGGDPFGFEQDGFMSEFGFANGVPGSLGNNGFTGDGSSWPPSLGTVDSIGGNRADGGGMSGTGGMDGLPSSNMTFGMDGS